MRLSPSRLLASALILGAGGLYVVTSSLQPRAYDTIRRANSLTVYEGLPHPMYEELKFQDEQKNKQTVLLSEYPFYREPLVLKPSDVTRLRRLLCARSTYDPYLGETECGGFHPDYAVEWSTQGKLCRSLICFGCSEVRIYGLNGEGYFYSLHSEKFGHTTELIDLLKAYRKNRPPHERFGLGPLAFSSSR